MNFGKQLLVISLMLSLFSCQQPPNKLSSSSEKSQENDLSNDVVTDSKEQWEGGNNTSIQAISGFARAEGSVSIGLDDFPKSAQDGLLTYSAHIVDDRPNGGGEYRFGFRSFNSSGKATEKFSPSDGTWEDIKKASIAIVNRTPSTGRSLSTFYDGPLQRGGLEAFRPPNTKNHLLYKVSENQWVIFEILEAKASSLNDGSRLIFKILKVKHSDGAGVSVPSSKTEAESRNLRPMFAFGSAEGDHSQSHVVVDITFGYSNHVEDAQGGRDAAIGRINLFLAYGNDVLKNSRTGVELRAVEFIRVEMESASVSDVMGRRDSGGLSSAYWSYHSPHVTDVEYDPIGNPYHMVYNRWLKSDSDLLTFFSDRSEGWCGLAKLLYTKSGSRYHFSQFHRQAFNVVGISCPIDSFIHEVGHNFGCMHDRENSEHWIDDVVSYAFGHKNEVSYHRDRFRTIMAYRCDKRNCPKIPYFSDPTQTYREFGLGGEENTEDNARNIREQAEFISNLSNEHRRYQ